MFFCKICNSYHTFFRRIHLISTYIIHDNKKEIETCGFANLAKNDVCITKHKVSEWKYIIMEGIEEVWKLVKNILIEWSVEIQKHSHIHILIKISLWIPINPDYYIYLNFTKRFLLTTSLFLSHICYSKYFSGNVLLKSHK